ncbi:FkbM family methyltransferase [Sphingomonadaceae bacterium G21617-S1]|nr:FkbM family methyltransferase [Sphingomonadaceae bacterium G21617-S1]
MGLYAVVKGITAHPLNQGAKLEALFRFARWQIASRLMRAPVVVPFVDDSKLLVASGMTGATGNWYCGLLEPGEMAFVLHALRAWELFADVGANVGAYTVLASGGVGAASIAVEPVPSTFASLQANLRLNNLTNVTALNCGLASIDGEIRFTTSLDCMNRVAREDDCGPTQIVPVTTIDKICEDRVPDIIKIDVEGYELPVLKGGIDTIASPNLQAIIMETNGSGSRFGVDDHELFEIMHYNGFSPHVYDWRRRELLAAPAGARNTIFVRHSAELSAKCQSAPRFKLVNGSI